LIFLTIAEENQRKKKKKPDEWLQRKLHAYKVKANAVAQVI
jgi:hypothetical protein